MKILKKLKQIKHEILVFALFVVSRLPKLGYDMFNTDVWKWKQRIYDFGSGVFYLDFAGTVQKYHPGVILMWLGSLAVKFHNLMYKVTTGSPPPDNDIFVIFQLHFLQKLFVVLAIGVTLAFVFRGLSKIIDKKYAYLAVLLIVLEPFYIALTRVVHLEGLMSTFMVASFVWFYLYLQDESRSLKPRANLYLSAFFAACAFLTKSSSLFLLPFFGLMAFLFDYLPRKRKNEKGFLGAVQNSLLKYGPWLLITAVFFVIIWPAMLVVPIHALATVWSGIFNTGVEQGHLQIFMGRLVTDPGVIFYPAVFFYRSSLYLLAGLVAYPFLRNKISVEKRQFALYAFLFGFLYAVEMTIPSKKLDRYLLPTIISFVLIATFPIELSVEKFAKFLKLKTKELKKGRFYKNARILAVIFILVPAISCASYLHPNYFSYYNPLGGGLEKGIFVIEPKWIFGQDELLAYMRNLMEADNLSTFKDETLQSLYYSDKLRSKLVVAFPEKYYTQLWPFVRDIDGWATIEALLEDAKQSNYYILPVWDDNYSQKEEVRLTYRDSIYVRGVEIFKVYDAEER